MSNTTHMGSTETRLGAWLANSLKPNSAELKIDSDRHLWPIGQEADRKAREQDALIRELTDALQEAATLLEDFVPILDAENMNSGALQGTARRSRAALAKVQEKVTQ